MIVPVQEIVFQPSTVSSRGYCTTCTCSGPHGVMLPPPLPPYPYSLRQGSRTRSISPKPILRMPKAHVRKSQKDSHLKNHSLNSDSSQCSSRVASQSSSSQHFMDVNSNDLSSDTTNSTP